MLHYHQEHQVGRKLALLLWTKFEGFSSKVQQALEKFGNFLLTLDLINREAVL